MEILLLIFLTGWAITYLKPEIRDSYKKINKLIIYIVIPCLTFSKVSQLKISDNILYPAAAAWVIFIIAAIFIYAIAKPFQLNKKTIGCLILCCGLGNTSFIGYPFIQYYFGEKNMTYAIFVDQPGSFLILSTLGISVATYFGSNKHDLKAIIRKIISFPPFIIFIAALVIPSFWIDSNIINRLASIGKLVTPLAIFSIGMQFNLNFKEIPWKSFFIGIVYKLVLAPLIIYITYFIILQKNNMISTISVIECAMPPMITASILATEFELDEKLAASLPTLGLLVSIPTLLIWKSILT